jgi:hypothetical protein
MRKRVLVIALLSVVVLVLVGGSVTALATSYGKLTGGMYFVADWGGTYEVWQRYNIHETEPWWDEQGVRHNAVGHIDYKIYHEDWGWRRVDTIPVCIEFGVDTDGTPMATIVLQITRVEGWGHGEPGEHSKFFIRDGGTPGSAGDQWNMEYYQAEPWIEFWPKDVPPPECSSSNPANMDYWWDISRGDLMIHP